MKLRRVKLNHKDEYSVAVRQNGHWVPLKSAFSGSVEKVDATGYAAAGDMISFLQGGRRLQDKTRRILGQAGSTDYTDTFDPVPLLPFQPMSFRDFMLYEKHVIDAGKGFVRRFMPKLAPVVTAFESITGKPYPKLRPKNIWYEKPIYYMGSHINFYTEGQTIPWPAYTKVLDYELEIGLVIVKPLYNATAQEALQAIGGFTIINDFSARDIQLPEMMSGFGPVKSKNFANAMGHVIVTADEILPRLEDLSVRVIVNGEKWSEGSTAGPYHRIEEAVAYASAAERILPGELMATGTIPGCSGIEAGRWLSPGDRIVLEADGLGSLENTLSAIS